LGARGFVLESAIADDEEMGVVRRGSVGQREFLSRVTDSNCKIIADRTPDTPTL
jgi:hypothetical protein